MEERTKKNNVRRGLLILGNAVLVAAILLLCFRYVRMHQAEYREAAEESFAANVSSMRSVANSVLDESQLACKDWAVYINSADMTMDEALDYLDASNANEQIMAHILDYDSYRGFSSVTDEKGNNEVDYSSFSDAVQSVSDTADISITSAYTNPITHHQSIGFTEDIMLKDEDGGTRHYLLIRVVPADYLLKKWDFPSQYKGGELSLVAENGDFIIKSASMKSANVWEFVRIYNEIGYKEAGQIRDDFYSGKTEILDVKDSTGNDCCMACIPYSEDNHDMYYVAIIPASALAESKIDLALVFIVEIGMLLILLLNSMYILYMNKQLRRSNELAQEASNAKTDFLSSMSHDIRTPMNAIIGMTAIAKEHVDEPERVEDSLSKIELSGRHLLTLINDVLDISSIESGKLTLNPSAFSLTDAVNANIDMIRLQAEEKEQDLEVDLSGIECDRLYADELRLNQIFINLLSNAVKYTDNGGSVSVEVESHPAEGTDGSAEVIYTVSDTGVGMSEEFMKTMFDPFTRMKDLRLDKTQGTGLGLAITKQMVDLMDGTIECSSRLGEGTTFTVNLTLPEAELTDEEEISQDAEEAAAKLAGMKILVAEDNDLNWEIIHEMLSMHEMATERAENGAEALEMIEKNAAGTYDAVFMDVHMPVMDGREATIAIRALSDEGKNDIPIIAMTADAFAQDVQACLDAGMNDHIAKPVDMKKVIAALGKIAK